MDPNLFSIPYRTIDTETTSTTAIKPIPFIKLTASIKDIPWIQTLQEHKDVDTLFNPANDFPRKKVPFDYFKSAFSVQAFDESLFQRVLLVVDFDTANDGDIAEMMCALEKDNSKKAKKFLVWLREALETRTMQNANTKDKLTVFRFHTLTGTTADAFANIHAKTGDWSIYDVINVAAKTCNLTPLKLDVLFALMGEVSLKDLLQAKADGPIVSEYITRFPQHMATDELFRLAVYISEYNSSMKYQCLADLIQSELGHPITFDTFQLLRSFYKTKSKMQLMWTITDMATVTLRGIVQLCKTYPTIFPFQYMIESYNYRVNGGERPNESEDVKEDNVEAKSETKIAPEKQEHTIITIRDTTFETPFDCLVGRPAKQVVSLLANEHPDKKICVCPNGVLYTEKFLENRIRVYIHDNGTVAAIVHG